MLLQDTNNDVKCVSPNSITYLINNILRILLVLSYISICKPYDMEKNEML